MGRERRKSRLAGNRGLSFPPDVPLITRPAKRCSIRSLARKTAANSHKPAFGRNNPLNLRVVAVISNTHTEWTMNWDRVEGNWKTLKGQVQQKWGKLTDDDLDVIEGKRTELAGRLQERYGYAKDEAEKNIDTWLNTVN